MAYLDIPDFVPIEIVRAATLDERKQMLADWNRELAERNPLYFHKDGTSRSFLNMLFGHRR